MNRVLLTKVRRAVVRAIDAKIGTLYPLERTLAARPTRLRTPRSPQLTPIVGDALPSAMRLRVVKSKPEACVNTYHGPMVLADETVLGGGCVAAMDAQPDLVIRNVLSESLLEIWRGEAVRRLRESFTDGSLNPTCTKCDVYRNLDLCRSSEGRRRARLNEARAAGR